VLFSCSLCCWLVCFSLCCQQHYRNAANVTVMKLSLAYMGNSRRSWRQIGPKSRSLTKMYKNSFGDKFTRYAWGEGRVLQHLFVCWSIHLVLFRAELYNNVYVTLCFCFVLGCYIGLRWLATTTHTHTHPLTHTCIT